MIPSLLDLFSCPEPRGRCRLTYKACLRRQQQTRTVRNGSTNREVPTEEHCALHCEKGREVAAMFPGVKASQSVGSFATFYFRPVREKPAARPSRKAKAKAPPKPRASRAKPPKPPRFCACGCGRKLGPMNRSGVSSENACRVAARIFTAEARRAA